MKRLLSTVLLVLLVAGMSFAQTSKAKAAPRRQAGQKTTPAPAAPKSNEKAAASASLPTEDTVNSFLKYMFGYDPQIKWQILSIEESEASQIAEVMIGVTTPGGQQSMRLYVTPDQKWATTGELIPFGVDPFKPARELIAAKANGPAKGPENAPITIVEFTDLQCPACKAAQPTIERLLQDVPGARFIFQNFPLEAMHPWAFKAAAYTDCMGRTSKDGVWKFVQSVYENQAQISEANVEPKLKELAAQAGANGDSIAACAAQPATSERVRMSQALGTQLGISSTPTLFVNGRKVANVNGIPYDSLKAVVMGTPK